MNGSINVLTEMDKVYLDLQISNINNGSKGPIILDYNQERSTPILNKASDYQMSITRFSLTTTTLPVFVPTIKYQSTSVGDTIYSLTLSWTDTSTNITYNQQNYVQYLPQNLSISTPSAPSLNENGLANNQNTYYNIYNYQYWVYLINNTFTDCYNSLNSTITGLGKTLPSTHAPVMTYDIQNNIAIINCDLAGYDTTASNYIKIYFNQPMYELFSSFPVIIQDLNTTTDGKNCQIITNSFSQANTISFPPSSSTPYTAIQVFQEFTTSLTLWSPVAGLVFTSNSIPVVSSGVTSPLNYVNGSIILANSNNNIYSSIITDFISDSNYKPNIVYEPTAQYRFFQLINNSPLKQIQLSVYWRSKDGTLNQFYLSNGGTMTIKFYFEKIKRDLLERK